MVQIPFCHDCGRCSCKVCDDGGKEYLIKASLNKSGKVDIEILEISTSSERDINGKYEESLKDVERFEGEFNIRGELVLKDYSNCIPSEDYCNCG